MSPSFRNVALGIILLAVIVTAATSCKKQAAEVKKQEVEPWPIAAIWVGGGLVDRYQDDCAPQLIVYSDGRLIVKKTSRVDRRIPPVVSFWTKVLTPDQLSGFQEQMLVVINDPDLEPFISVATATDLPMADFYFGTLGKSFSITVDGLWLEQLGDVNFLNSLARFYTLPDNIFGYCASLATLDLGDLEPWVPAGLTVQFSPCVDSSAKCRQWPDRWPGPNSKNATRSRDDRFIVLDIKEQADLGKYFGSEMHYDSVEIEVAGKRYKAEYHFRFPGEESWCSEFRVIDLDSFVQPVTRLRPPVVPKPVLPTRVDLK